MKNENNKPNDESSLEARHNQYKELTTKMLEDIYEKINQVDDDLVKRLVLSNIAYKLLREINNEEAN